MHKTTWVPVGVSSNVNQLCTGQRRSKCYIDCTLLSAGIGAERYRLLALSRPTGYRLLGISCWFAHPVYSQGRWYTQTMWYQDVGLRRWGSLRSHTSKLIKTWSVGYKLSQCFKTTKSAQRRQTVSQGRTSQKTMPMKEPALSSSQSAKFWAVGNINGPVWRVLAELWRGHHGSPTT